MLCPVINTSLLLYVSKDCSIEAQGFGMNDDQVPKQGFLKLNGDVVWQASFLGNYSVYRGANMFVVDTSICTLVDLRHFDTFGEVDAAVRLRDYIEGLSLGTVLVSVSCDAASGQLDAAEATLTGLGADVSDVENRGAWAFVAVKGDPSKTVLDKELTPALALERDPIVTVTFEAGKAAQMNSYLSNKQDRYCNSICTDCE